MNLRTFRAAIFKTHPKQCFGATVGFGYGK
jgi:hypothetical protein